MALPASALARESRDSARGLLDEAALPGSVMDASLLRLLDFMYKVELFQQLDAEEILQLAPAFQRLEAQDGEKIVSQGDEGDQLFFIECGTVSVRVSNGGKEREITTLSHGDYFGEAALLHGAPRNASVYALGEVQLRSLSRERFEAFDLHRKLNLEVRDARMKNGLRELMGGLVSVKTFCKAVLLIGIYFGVAVLIFSSLEGWTGLDVVYFSIITLMTVGYGDYAPKHWGSRLTLVFFVLASLVLVATSIGEFLETLVALEIRNERARKALQLKQARVGVFDYSGQRQRWRRRTCACVGALLGLLLVSSLLAKAFAHKCHTWVDALYFSVVTLSTIGYGDLTPGREPGSRVVVGILVLFGVPFFGMMLARIVEIAYGRAKKMGLPAVVGGLTNEKFEQLIEFTDQLWRAGGYNSRPQESLREEITPFEFLCFMLTQNESVSLDEIKQIMANFSELDLNKTGLLDQSTVDEWLRRGSSNPQGFAPSRRLKRLTTSPSNATGLGPSPCSSLISMATAFTDECFDPCHEAAGGGLDGSAPPSRDGRRPRRRVGRRSFSGRPLKPVRWADFTGFTLSHCVGAQRHG
ncbi:unnamed protein product [Durusdinium trenchii]|uniref:Cyclic nucleotide-binding domain-containing protein n=1 Tax=Durusdinium trenchii TaxID=1381693 RepID=A0ABP0NSM4_9DINO